MQYLILLHETPSATTVPGNPEWEADLAAFERFGELAGDRIVGGEALHPEGHVIRQAADGPVVTDGPFAETAEVLGGYFVLDADDLDAVLELAAAIPTASTGVLEIRPVVGATWDAAVDVPPDASRYVAVLHGAPTDVDRPGTDAWDAAVAEQARFSEEHGDVLLGGAAVHPPQTATTLRVRDGRPQITDGPFAETAEVVGGWYVLWARSTAQAIATASAIPVGDGAVELRPVIDLDA